MTRAPRLRPAAADQGPGGSHPPVTSDRPWHASCPASDVMTMSLSQPAAGKEMPARDSRREGLGLPLVQQAGAFGDGGGLHPAGDSELAQDAADVHAGGA